MIQRKALTCRVSMIRLAIMAQDPRKFLPLDLKQAIAYLSESDFRSAAATEPAGLV
jgi:hypothetical protein